MRIARDLGTVSHLLPTGIRSLRDAPYPLFQAIKRALMFLSFEELPEEDLPPRNIWMDNEDLSNWFKQLKEDRRRDDGGDSLRGAKRNSILADMGVR